METENNTNPIQNDTELIQIDTNYTKFWKAFLLKSLGIIILPFIFVLLWLILSIIAILAFLFGFFWVLFRFGQSETE